MATPGSFLRRVAVLFFVPAMAPKDALRDFVANLAEAEQILSGSSSGSGGPSGRSNSVAASEERDSAVEGAAVMDDLERSSSVGTKSEVGSVESRPHAPDAVCLADDPSSERVARLHHADEEEDRGPQQEGENAGSERQLLRLSMRETQRDCTIETSNLRSMPDSSRNVDTIRDELRNHLDMANKKNRESADELTEQRMKMVDNDEMHMAEVGDLRMMLDTANFQLEKLQPGGTAGASSSSSHLLNLPGGSRQKAASQAAHKRANLAPIEEKLYTGGLDESGGSSGSGNVSCTDSSVFEDGFPIDPAIEENARSKQEISALEEAAAHQKAAAKVLAAEVAIREASSEMRILHLMTQFEAQRQDHALTREELEAMRNPVCDEDAGRAPQLQGPGPQQGAAVTEEIREQFYALREAKRIAEARVEDLKRALASESAQHKRELEELKQRLQRSLGDADDDARDIEIKELRERLRSAQEERNVLVNTAVWKELQWTSQIENLQLELEETKRRHESDVKRLEFSISAGEVAAREAVEVRPRPQDASVAGQDASILGWIRCPMRSSRGPGGIRPAFCQMTCWKVISAMSGVVALWCCMKDHTILESSREANRIWGSAMLQGKSLFSLVSGPSGAAWLKKAFESHQRMAQMEHVDEGLPGFIVRDLGCEAFCSKSGDDVDATVIMAHFPAEPSRGRAPALLVILETEEVAATRARGAALSRQTPGRTARRTPSSTGSASSVAPSDSASNVFLARGL